MFKKLAFVGVGLAMFVAPLAASAQSTDVQSQIAALLAELKQLQVQLLALQGQGGEQSNCVNLSNNLTLGSSGSDVTNLQNYLINSGVLDAQYNTGYYGFITAKAVGTIQMNLNVLTSINDPAYGIVGPKTRTALACGGSQPTAILPPPTGGSSPSQTPSATIDQNSLTASTGGKDAAPVTLSGSASNVTLLGVFVDGGANGGNAKVTNGRWSETLPLVVNPGTHSVTIMDADTGSMPSDAQPLATGTLTVTGSSAPAPYITSTSAKAANNLEVDAGGEVNILGQNLATVDSTNVYIGGYQAQVTWTSDTQVNATVPSNLTPGQTYDLYISNGNGTSNTVRVAVLSTVAPASTISSINPSTATTNTPVTIYGSNLSGVSSIQVSASGGQVVASLVPSSVTPTSVSFTLNGSFIGIQGPGTYQLAVVSSGGTSNALTFTVNSAQPVASFDVSSMSFQTATPLITGSASNVNEVSITIKGGGATARVVNGRWQAYLNGVTPGTYQVGVLDNDQGPYFNTTLATGSMTVSLQTASTNPRNLPQCPANSAQQRSQMGQTFDCYCPPGFAIQTVWGGPGYYTDNSDICTAGAQSGQMNQTSGGEVDYTISPGQSSYSTWTSNGITSQAYGWWPGSFQITGPKG